MKKLTIGLLSCLLTACGGPPSEADIREALERKNLEIIKAGEQLQGKAWAEQARKEVKVYNVKLSGCKEEGKNTYRCTIEVDWVTPLAPRHTMAMAPLVYRGSHGWTVP